MKVTVEYNEILSYVTYLNRTAVIQTLSLFNDGTERLENLELKIIWDSPIAESWQQSDIDLEVGQILKINFEKNPLRLIGREFAMMTEGYQTAFRVIINHGEEILCENRFDIQVLAYNQWLGSNYHPALITSFVTPNSPFVNRIVQRAGEILKDWNLSLSGYQTQDKNDVRAQMKAIYLSMQAEQIGYVSAPPSFEGFGQRVRLAEDIMVGRLANCIEMAVLYAACLELAGLNPLLILLEGHAFAGCWLEDQTFAGSIDDDGSALNKRLAKGIQSIELVETTLLTERQAVDYETAVGRAEEQVVYGQKFEYLVDVVKSRSLGIRPLPQKTELLPVSEMLHADLPLAGNLSDQSLPQSLEQSDNIEIITSQKRSRLKVWESKLLNLTLRNNLLNFRPTRRSISILEGDLNELEDNLSSGKEFSLVACPAEIEGEKRKEKEYSYTRSLKDEYREYMNTEMKSGRLVTLMNEEDLNFAIKALYYEARTELEENGANTLFVAMGFLKWFETELSKQPRFAPILLYPVEMIRKSSAKGYVIRYRDEEVQVNTTLLEKMRMELNLEFPGLVPLPVDEHGVDVKKVLNTMRTAILNKKGWDVIDVSYIGLFSFNQFVMWNDIHSRSEELMDNPIVGSLMQGKINFQTPSLIDSYEIDSSDLFFNNAVLMDADSSQLVAVYSASKGSSFVLHGPPGTGKSQTITNIIASALYNNKSVLFVAEKMAALNVVQARLEKIGIGDFALELHSNKTKKSEVLAKIERILDKKKNGEIKEIQEKRENLNKIRDEIIANNQALHQTKENGYSIYEMIALYEQQRTDIKYPVGRLAETVTKERIGKIEQSIDRLLPLLAEVAPVGANPLAIIKNHQLSFKEREQLRQLMIQSEQNLAGLASMLGEFPAILTEDTDFSTLSGFIQVLRMMIEAEHLLWHYIKRYGSEDIDPRMPEMIDKGREQDEIRHILLDRFQPAILQENAQNWLLTWNQVSQQWFLPKWLGQNKLLKTIRAYALQPNALTKENMTVILEQLLRYQTLAQETEPFMNVQAAQLEALWQGNNTDWSRLQQAVTTTQRITAKLRELRTQNVGMSLLTWLETAHQDWLIYKEEKRLPVQQMYDLVMDLKSSQEQIQTLADAGVLQEESSLAANRSRASRILSSYNGIDTWLAYAGVRAELIQLGLKDLVLKLENDEIAGPEFKAITIKSLMYGGIVENLEKEKKLSGFNHHNFEYLLEEYRRELKIVTEMTRLELIEKLAANIPQPLVDVNINSELGILKKAIKNGGRGLSLRKLFDMVPNVLRKIAPCMLMSPISIAQYIDPSFPKFDLVIFDEASQVNTHSAVGAIARGKQLIVVGDPNQLPPTSFFKGNFEDEEIEFEEADQASILDECQAIMFPELHLKWHYRSKHESLIAFSNTQYYENKLYTFPSYNDLESKVRLVEVEGTYDRSGTKQNVAEAEAIIAEVRRRLMTPSLRQQSLGIVTFSSVQQKLIQTMLDELFAGCPQLEEHAQQLGEEIFVKNLENVQGDERDVILFSIGYGPDKQGKVTMNFGPLNHSGGWKRLNVVVSRSREEMIVYSALRPEQIDLSRTDALGVVGLKRFLEFARNKNSLMVDAQTARRRKDELIEAIAAELEKEGYAIVKQVGKSNYRIDIGVVNQEKSNEFMAAIVVDGYQYYETPTVRDKTVVQPFMLNRLKWKVISVWAVEWFKNKASVMAMIKSRLKQIQAEQRQMGMQPQPTADNFSNLPQKEEFNIEYVQIPEKAKIYYQAYPLAENQYAKEDFYKSETLPMITGLIREVIAFEAPVTEEDLFRRISAVWGISQLGSKVMEILKTAVAGTNAFRVLDDHQNTYWRSREHYENGAVARRYQDSKRKFTHICDDEIKATIYEILGEQISLDFKNLCKEVFKFHGYNMLGEEAQNTVYRAVQNLIQENKVLAEEDRYLKV